MDQAVHHSFLLTLLFLEGELFNSLLGKIHAFCMVDLNKKGTWCIFEFRSSMREVTVFFSECLGESC